jgi:hypothetical protein
MRGKNICFSSVCILLTVLFLGFTAAVAVGENLHLNIQTTNVSTGEIISGTFDFVFNISTTSNCGTVVYSNSTSLTTDSRGIVSYYLEDVDLSYSDQLYLCYYRDSVLINSSEIARVPYAFRARNVTLSGVEIDQNFDLGSYNFTAAYLFGDGSGLSNLNVSAIDLSGYVPYTNSLANIVLGDYDFSVGTSDFFVDASTGNVGIGTSNPLTQLHINSSSGDASFTGLGEGVARFSAVVSTNEFVPIGFTTNNFLDRDLARIAMKLGSSSSSSLHFGTSLNGSGVTNDAMVIDSSGNVGIGTGSPGLNLVVAEVTNALPLSSGTQTEGGFRIRGASPLGNTVLDMGITPTTGGAWLQATNVAVSSIQYPLLLNPNGGNVGIGTASPEELLHISSSDGSTFFKIRDTRSNTGDLAGIMFGTGTAPNGAKSMITHIETGLNGVGDLVFAVDNIEDTGEVTILEERMRIDSSGNVGIGTTTPQEMLHVVGNGLFNGSINMDSNKITSLANGTSVQDAVTLGQLQSVNNTVSGDYVPYTGATSNLVLGDNNFSVGGSDLFVDGDGGNVGIGTGSPSKTLDVSGTGQVSGEFFMGGGHDTYGGSSRYRDDLKLAFGTGRDYTMGYVSSDDTFQIVDGNALGTNVGFAIASGGNVGIGTASPEHELDIMKDGGADLRIRGISSTNTSRMLIGATSAREWGVIARPHNTYGNSLYDLEISYEGAASGGNILLNPTAGNVGIGTTSPSEKLEVNGTAQVNTLALPTGGLITYQGYNIIAEGSGMRYASGHNTRPIKFYIGDGVSGSEEMRIDTDGNVGIGTSTPSYKLDVAGTINAYDVLINGSTISASGLGAVTGSGTAWRIPMWNGSTSLNNSNIYQSGNNIGIGTSTPSSKIHINNSGLGYVDSSLLIGGANGESVSALIELSRGSTGRLSGVRYQTDDVDDWFTGTYYNGGAGQSNFGIGTGWNILDQKLIIDSEGNVGINNTSPTETLEVNGTFQASNEGSSMALNSDGDIRIGI